MTCPSIPETMRPAQTRTLRLGRAVSAGLQSCRRRRATAYARAAGRKAEEEVEVAFLAAGIRHSDKSVRIYMMYKAMFPSPKSL